VTHRGREKEDGERQAWLEQRGYKVVRCTNHESFEDFDVLLEVIWRECQERKGIRWRGGPLTPNPSPPVGRGE
jgi:very-short-patch-repair endonuclease